MEAKITHNQQNMADGGEDHGLALLRTLIAEIKGGGVRLPCLPDLATRVRKAVSDPKRSISDVSRLVQLEPALTARIVQIANSPLYRGSRKIDNCHTAITRLGLDVTRNLVVSFTLRNLFQPESRQLAERLQQVWRHSCRVGAISSVLARLIQGVDPDRALLAGLVHDIGELPVLEYMSHASPAVAAELESAIPRLRGPLGSFILKTWEFEDDLTAVPRLIEVWERPLDGPIDYVDVTQVAHVHALFGSHESYQGPPLPELAAFNKMSLSQLGPASSMEVLEQSQQEINEVMRILQA